MLSTATPSAVSPPTSFRFVRLLRNILALCASQIVTWTCTALLVAFVPRYLGDDNLGKLFLATFLVNLLSLVSDLGSNAYLIREIARKKPEDLPQYTFNALVLRLPLSLAACLAGVALVNALGYDTATKTTFYLVLPVVPLQSLSQMLNATLLGVQRMQPLAFSSALAKVLHAAAVVIALQSGYGVYTVAAFASIPWIVNFVFALFYSRRYVTRKATVNLGTLKAIAIGGLPFLVWQASQTIYGQLDILQLSLMTRDSVVGWYSAAYQIILIPAFLPTILLMAVYPMLSTLAHTNRDEFSEISRRCLQIIMLTVTPIAFATAVLAGRIIDLFSYPDEFKNSIPLIGILALQMPSAAASTLLGTCLMTLDLQSKWAKVAVGAAILNPIINLLLIPMTSKAFGNGAIGAALTTDLTEIFMVSWAIMLLPRGIFGLADLRYAAACIVAGAIMAGVVWTVRDAHLVFAIAVGGVAYLAAAFVMGALRLSDAKLALTYLRSAVTPRTQDSSVL